MAKKTGKIHRAKSWLASMWWFDLIYPMALAIVLFAGLTHIVYSGRPSSRLSNRAEGKILEFSLLVTSFFENQQKSTKELTVDIFPEDFQSPIQDTKKSGLIVDLSIASYVSILEYLAAKGVEKVFLAWNPIWHPDDQAYYQPLIDLARRVRPSMQILLSVSGNKKSALPENIDKDITILDSAPCNEVGSREIFCAHTPDNLDYTTTYIVQTGLLDLKNQEDELSSYWLTDVLPSNISAFALNLPSPKALSIYSLRNISQISNIPGAKRVFLGIRHDHLMKSDTLNIQTRFNLQKSSFTPIHHYWAQLSHMIHSKNNLRFIPQWVAWIWSLAIAALMSWAMLTLGGVAATSMLLCYLGCVVPFLAIILGRFGWYLPAFDSMYFGSAMLAFVGAGRLSHLSYLKWLHQAEKRQHGSTTDLKNNFLSLVSHNLNTPIAKMQGMLSLIIAELKDETIRSHFLYARKLTTLLEFNVKFVLETIAIAEDQTQDLPKSLSSFMQGFRDRFYASLKNLGIELEVIMNSDDEDLFMIPLRFDEKRLGAGLAALIILGGIPTKLKKMSIILKITETLVPDRYEASFTVSMHSSTWKDQTDFIQELAIGLLEKLSQKYHGNFVENSQSNSQRELALNLSLSPYQ